MPNHTTMQTLRALLSDRAEVVSQIAALKAEVAQIEAQISEVVAAQDGPRITRDLQGGLPPLSPEVELVVYRVAQESLTNALRHAAAGVTRGPSAIAGAPDDGASDDVFALAMRPFLSRCAEVIQQRSELSLWAHPHCALCGGEPELAVITPTAERHLICGRCGLRWNFESLTCPFCRNGDRSRITSFATPDGRYRVYACDVCTRYLKAYDGRRATRPVMPVVDGVATLPLDAAAMQRGYSG